MDYTKVCGRGSLRLQDSTFVIIPFKKLFKCLLGPQNVFSEIAKTFF